jgi:hypothetical protein
VDLSPLALILIGVAFLLGMAVQDYLHSQSCAACRWNPHAPLQPEWKPRICAYTVRSKDGLTSSACTHLTIVGEDLCRQHWQLSHGVGSPRT